MPLAPWEVRRAVMKSMERAHHNLGGTDRRLTWMERHKSAALMNKLITLAVGRRVK